MEEQKDSGNEIVDSHQHLNQLMADKANFENQLKIYQNDSFAPGLQGLQDQS